MLKKVFGRVFSSSVFYILISLLAAMALWMYVEINYNDEDWKEVTNVNIKYINEELLRDRKLLISSANTQNLTLGFYVSRALARELNSTTVYAEVDLADVWEAGLKYLKYNIQLPPGIKIDAANIKRSVSNIALNIDRLVSRPIDVTVDYKGGTASDDLFVLPVVYEPMTIMIYGPEETISKIGSARVSVPRESLAETYTGDLGFVLQDINGEGFSDDILEMMTPSQNTVHVTIPIKQYKRVYLDIELAHGAGTTGQNTTYTITPEYIEVSGDPADLIDLNTLTLRTINTVLYRNMSFSVTNCAIVLPNLPIENETGIYVATVTVNIDNSLEIRDYSTSNLLYSGLPAGMRVEWITNEVTVSIRGRSDLLDLVTPDNIRIVVDLREKANGIAYRLEAVVYVDGISPEVGAVGSYIAALRLVSDLG